MSGPNTPRRPYTAEVIMARRQGKNYYSASSDAADLAPAGAQAGQTSADDSEVLRAIAALREDVLSRLDQGAGPDQAAPPQTTEPAEAGAGIPQTALEKEELARQLTELSTAIEEAKEDIWSLRDHKSQSGDDVKAATKELDAVVKATEAATNDIMEAAEQIDDLASRLCSQLSEASDTALAEEINERVVNIFEACNFQDITGQRITKVVNTLEFIDERVTKMMKLWGAEQVEGGPGDGVTRDEDLLNGPSLEGEGSTQDDIDALFD